MFSTDFRLCVIVVAASLLPTPRAFAQQPVEFNHRSQQETAYTRHLKDGEELTIIIRETCEAAFSYEVRGIRREPEDTSVTTSSGEPQLTDKTLSVIHNEAYGGYIVNITRELPTGADACGGATRELRSQTLIISTPKMDWDLAFSGGFTISGLTDPVYALQPHPTETDKKQIVHDADKQDFANLGIATFVHMYHERVPWLAGMFGLGIRESNQTEYYLGGGLRLNDRATINFGWALGSVARLPAGVSAMDPVTDDNVLMDLPRRVTGKLFMGISYSFINVGDRLQRPFAGASGSGTPPAAAAASTPAAAPTACRQVTLADADGVVATDVSSPVTLEFPANGGDRTLNVSVSPPNCAWSLDGTPGWALLSEGRLERQGDARLTFTASPNDTGSPHEETIAINGLNQSFTLTQEAQ